jgi:hypothetical protein
MSSSEGRAARVLRISVATSPGEITQARMPLRHSSILSDSVMAIIARLLAL